MSRSNRKSPIFGMTTATSEKSDKQMAHRAERVHSRQAISNITEIDALMITTRAHAHSNRYSFAKDGKHYAPLSVTYEGRSMQVRRAPSWMKSVKEVHKALAK